MVAPEFVDYPAVKIPEGVYQMGAPWETDGHVHLAKVSAFFMAETEVTWGEWKVVYDWALQHGYEFKNPGAGSYKDRPVYEVSWFDAVKWCNAKSEMAGRKPCYYSENTFQPETVYRSGELLLDAKMVDWNADGYRLPTEAEWEKGGRGKQNGMRFPNGDTLSTEDANFTSPGPKSVRSYPANGYGLYDMAGNVMEWCWDGYAKGYSEQLDDPLGVGKAAQRVVRGGGWMNKAEGCRVSYRGSRKPEHAGDGGFRWVYR
jgi:formylglycine-generating enzyme required for sulfatase activity